MKWTVLNALGGLAWLAGLEYAKGADLPIAPLVPIGDEHRLLVGIVLALVGLTILAWANLRSAA